MKFGIRFIDYLGSLEDIIGLTVLAEQAGFDFAWYPHDTFMRNTWVTTSAAAMRTSRIGIGSVGTNPYSTDPAEIATYLASLDELSGGRAVLGLGLHTHDMVAWTGHDAGDCIDRTRAAVTMVRRLLSGEVVDHQDSAFQWSEQCYLRFRPYRKDVPIYVSAFGPEYLAMSGAIADGSLPMITPPESAAYMVPAIIQGAREAGRDPGEVDIAGCAWLSLSDTGAHADHVLRQMVAYFGPYLEGPALATIGLSPTDFHTIEAFVAQGRYEEAAAAVTDDMLRLAIIGTPHDVIARIEGLAALGVTQVNLGGPLGPDPARAIRLMGEQVIPYFR